jgi:hypothetical protein
MAMTKKEKERFAELEKELRCARSWRLTDRVSPDVAPPANSSQVGSLSTGFTVVGGCEWLRADVACSSATSHATGSIDKTNSQRPISLYSSRLLALRAARNKAEDYAIEILSRIDRLIEDEIAAQEHGDGDNP